MIDLDTLVARAAELFDVLPEQVAGRGGRNRRITGARQAVAWVLRQHDYTLSEIGLLLGRDHTTIIYSLKAATARAAEHPDYAALLRALSQASEAEREPTIRQTIERRSRQIDWQHWWTYYALAGKGRPLTA